jgi:DUF4097 and DUF4098 domain-containing protein YvlB
MNGFVSRMAGLGLGVAMLVSAGAGVARRADAAELRRVTERLIPFAPGGAVSIDDKNGRLTVEGWSRKEVRIQVTRRVRAPSDAKAEELMRELQADVEVRNNRINIRSRFPKRHETIGVLDLLARRNISLQIDYYVQVPRETDVELLTTNGEVQARALSGSFEATTTNGDMHVGDLKGTTTLATNNGVIQINGVSGTTHAQSTNGAIYAEVHDVASKGEITLETTNGNVEAYFPSRLKATLDAVTTNGRISIDYPILRQGVTSGRSIQGTINGGGARITLRTTNGNVDVKKLRERGRSRPERGAS